MQHVGISGDFHVTRNQGCPEKTVTSDHRVIRNWVILFFFWLKTTSPDMKLDPWVLLHVFLWDCMVIFGFTNEAWSLGSPHAFHCENGMVNVDDRFTWSVQKAPRREEKWRLKATEIRPDLLSNKWPASLNGNDLLIGVLFFPYRTYHHSPWANSPQMTLEMDRSW